MARPADADQAVPTTQTVQAN